MNVNKIKKVNWCCDKPLTKFKEDKELKEGLKEMIEFRMKHSKPEDDCIYCEFCKQFWFQRK